MRLIDRAAGAIRGYAFDLTARRYRVLYWKSGLLFAPPELDPERPPSPLFRTMRGARRLAEKSHGRATVERVR